MKVIYPAIIEKTDNQYWLEFPDLKGCQTWGDSLEEVLTNAEEALEGYVLAKLENGFKLEKASSIEDIPSINGTSKTYICVNVNTDSARPVKMTLTIPGWVNKIGIEHNINFSQTLTDAIISKYGN